jgi:hypothetical protein
LTNFRFITDYKTYVIGYNCDNIDDDEYSEDLMWAATVRKPNRVSQETKWDIINIMKKYFDPYVFKVAKHDPELECDYEIC